MTPRRTHEIRYAREALEHLQGFDKRHLAEVFAAIAEQLTYEPLVRTRNRKPLAGSKLFGPETWELRFGPGNRFRAFYRAEPDEATVYVKGIGVKVGSRLTIGGQEVAL